MEPQHRNTSDQDNVGYHLNSGSNLTSNKSV